MLVCEDSLEKAIHRFLEVARIPVPPYWSTNKDKAIVRWKIVPAFFEALKEIEDVDVCCGFDLSKVNPLDLNVAEGERRQ